MILPKNGRVIIIDDQPNQALPLIMALSKYNIASTYFNATKETIPTTRFNDVRVLFLDINLNDGPSNWYTEKSLIITYVSNIIEPNTPYILFVWSVNELGQFNDVVQLFDEELKEYKPVVAPIRMEKYNVFKQVENEIAGEKVVKWELNNSPEETIELIKSKVAEGIKTLDSFEAIIKWENVVSSSTTEVTNEIVSLGFGKESDLNEELKKIYYKLAEAMWGRQLKSDANEITLKALSVFNQLLSDKLEYNVMNGLSFSLINGLKVPDNFEEKDKAIFNSKLLLNFHNRVGAFPGNVYEHTGDEIEKAPFNGLIADSLFIPLVAEDFFESVNKTKAGSNEEIREFKNSQSKDYGKYEKGLRDLIKKSSRFISIEVSPICDFAQRKWKVNRVCPAILWNCNYANYIGKSENLYVSPVLYIGDNLFQLIIDLRYFSSHPFELLKDAKPIFGLKHSFLTDIQSLLSRHISRPGITSLN